ncbi:MAG TPA: hypothetical protein VK672_02195 [Solirubrobacteraceae bacterium]|nr:hypothetical protein [Solirubrobacteraceae bacterium]
MRSPVIAAHSRGSEPGLGFELSMGVDDVTVDARATSGLLVARAQQASSVLVHQPVDGQAGRFQLGHERTDHKSRHRLVGSLVHAQLAILASKTRFELEEISALLARMLRDVPLTNNSRRAIWVAVATQLKVYERFFRAPELQLRGAEVVLRDDSRCDLVWDLPDGRVLIDEIKTGAPARQGWLPDDQIQRYLDVARVRYGRDFFGLRVCWLRAPGLSATLDTSGRRKASGPLYAGASDADEAEA